MERYDSAQAPHGDRPHQHLETPLTALPDDFSDPQQEWVHYSQASSLNDDRDKDREDGGYDATLDVDESDGPPPKPSTGGGGGIAADALRYVRDPEHPSTRRTRNGLAVAAMAVYLLGIVTWIVLGAGEHPTEQVAAALVAMGPFVGAIVAWYFPGRDGKD